MGQYTGTQTDFEHVSNVNLLQLRVFEGPGGYAGPDMTIGSCLGSPEGVIIGWHGDARFDVENAALWMKTTGDDATAFGWTRVDAAGVAPALAALQAQVSALEVDVTMLTAQVFQNTADISTLQAEPYVTIGNSGTLSNERALTGSATVNIQDNGPNSTVVASVPANAITNTELADMAATSVKANPTALVADPQDVQALLDNTFFGRQGGVLGFFAVAGAALPQSFVTVSAEASLANERVATSSTTISVVDNGPGTTVQFNIVVNSVDNTLLSDMAALSVKANPTALAADPQDVAAAADNTFFGRVGGVLGFFTVSAGALPQSFVTTSAEASLPNERVLTSSSTVTITDNGAGSTVVPSVPANAITNTELADMPANTVKSNPTAGVADPQDLAMATNTVLLRAGGNISAFAVGTNTVLGRVAGDIVAARAVNAQLADMAANTIKSNPTAAPAAPQDQAIGTNEVVARAGGNLTSVAMAVNTLFAREGGDISPLAVGANEVPLRAGANLTTQAMATNTALVRAGGDITALAFGTNEVLLRAGGNLTDFAVGTNTVLGRVAGDIVAAQVVTGQVGDAQITDAKLANMGARTVKGRASNSSGVPADIAGAGANTFLSDDGTTLAFRTGPAGGLSLNNVQTFASPGTFSGGSGWQKPTGATTVLVRVWAAGGGGGGGSTTTGAVGRSGGAGGGGGAFKERWFLASELAAQETVVVGTGGTFGAGATTDSTDGSPGGIGGNSSFSSGTLGVTAYGGGGGAGGGRSNGAGTSNAGGGGGGTAGAGGVGGGPTGTPVSGTGGTPLYNNTQAAVGGVVGGQGARGATGNGPIPGGFAEYGGGGGGCNNAAATPQVQASGGSIFGGGGGGAGGNVSNDQVTVVTPGAGSASGQWAALGGGSAGTSGASPTPGGDGAPGTGAQGGAGGGGGGSTATADTNGAIGGNGGARGGGGGGGGCGRNTGDGGNGGRGGHGYVEIYSF
jgi:hypothetical protein